MCIESETSGVKSPTKPLRRRGRAQEGSSDLVAGKVFTVCIDCTPLYMYTNLVCIESETSGVKSACNPTKPLRRRGRAQEGSSDLVAGKVFTVCIDCTPLYMYTNLVCIESETSGVKSASNPTKPLRRHGRAQGGSSGLVAGILFVDCGPLYMHSNLACIESATSGTKRVKNTKRYPGESIYLAIYNRCV